MSRDALPLHSGRSPTKLENTSLSRNALRRVSMTYESAPFLCSNVQNEDMVQLGPVPICTVQLGPVPTCTLFVDEVESRAVHAVIAHDLLGVFVELVDA